MSYKKSIMPNDSRFSKGLSYALNFVVWAIATLFIVLGVAVFTTDPWWAIWLVLIGILVCPLVSIHFVAKLVLVAFALFPKDVAVPLSLALGITLGLMDLGRPLSPPEE